MGTVAIWYVLLSYIQSKINKEHSRFLFPDEIETKPLKLPLKPQTYRTQSDKKKISKTDLERALKDYNVVIEPTGKVRLWEINK